MATLTVTRQAQIGQREDLFARCLADAYAAAGLAAPGDGRTGEPRYDVYYVKAVGRTAGEVIMPGRGVPLNRARELQKVIPGGYAVFALPAGSPAPLTDFEDD